MKLYHLKVLIFCLLLGFFYFENTTVMDAISSLTGFTMNMASVHLTYLMGVCSVLILAYLIKKQDT